MIKCMTQTDPKDYLMMNTDKIKRECTIYATECIEYECQKCKKNRRFGHH